MPRNAAQHLDPVSGTLPDLNRRYRIGIKRLRRLAREGAFPVYTANTDRVRVIFSEFEDWLRSTRIEPTTHAKARVAEILDREGER